MDDKKCTEAFGYKIDVHAHFLSPTYYEYLKKYEDSRPDKFDIPDWSEEGHIKQMDKSGVKFSFISISTPNLSGVDDSIEKEYVRKINEEGAAFASKYPNRIGLMAELPLPNMEHSLEEAKYALDTLKAYGFGLKTHYRGKYLGSDEFEPLMEFFNTKKAVVVIHPTKPYHYYEGVNEDLPIPAFEYFVETTRTFANMVLKDTFHRYPQIKWVFPHAGAFISVLSDRFDSFSFIMKHKNSNLKVDFFGAMKHVYFDLAGFSLPKQIQILKQDVPVANMLYGSDAPYTPGVATMTLSGALEQTNQFTKYEKSMIFTQNAIDLFPGLVTVMDTAACVNRGDIKNSQNRWRRIRKVIAWIYLKIQKKRHHHSES